MFGPYVPEDQIEIGSHTLIIRTKDGVLTAPPNEVPAGWCVGRHTIAENGELVIVSPPEPKPQVEPTDLPASVKVVTTIINVVEGFMSGLWQAIMPPPTGPLPAKAKWN